jgi:hypothetical protein
MPRKLGSWGLALLAALVLGVGGAGGRALATTIITVEVIGGGEVTDSGGQIQCGDGDTSCYGTYVVGTSVTLTAAAPAGWTFSSWDCTGTTGVNTCTVLLDGSSHEETATFAPTSSVG